MSQDTTICNNWPCCTCERKAECQHTGETARLLAGKNGERLRESVAEFRDATRTAATAPVQVQLDAQTRGQLESLARHSYGGRFAVYMSGDDARAILARHAPEALGAATWQPIETAPKTGRTLLLGYLNEAGKWRTVRGQWMSADYIDMNWEDPDDPAGSEGWYETAVNADEIPNCWAVTPTHWMPLPQPPAILAKAKEGS